jgi:hypothetical protein
MHSTARFDGFIRMIWLIRPDKKQFQGGLNAGYASRNGEKTILLDTFEH